jgi:hypothetical protein
MSALNADFPVPSIMTPFLIRMSNSFDFINEIGEAHALKRKVEEPSTADVLMKSLLRIL